MNFPSPASGGVSPAVIALSWLIHAPASAVVGGFQVSFMHEAVSCSQPFPSLQVYSCEGFWHLSLELVFRRNSAVALQVP